MTQKEKLFLEYCKKKNELAALKGEPSQFNVSDDYIASLSFKKDAVSYRVEELKDKIKYVESEIREFNKRMDVDRWYRTPAGIRYKAAKTRELSSANQERRALIQDTEKCLNELVKTICGECWIVSRFSCGFNGNMTIGIKDEKKEGCCLFGESFDIYFATSDINGEAIDEFKISFSSHSSFSPETEHQTVEFVTGMARFLSNKYAYEKIKGICLCANIEAENFNRTIYRLNDEIKNPKIQNS